MGPLKGSPRDKGVVRQPVNCWTRALKLEALALRRVTGVVLEAQDLRFAMPAALLLDDLLVFELSTLMEEDESEKCCMPFSQSLCL